MRRFIVGIAVALAAALTVPAVASADPAICHNGVLSDDAGQGCADGGSGSRSGDAAICHNGILSDDAGQGCSDGLYEKLYSGASTSTRSGGGGVSTPVTTSGGSSNSMVNPNCESSGNSQVVSPNGTYWGKYQFDYGTWVSNGGSPGSYGSAPESVQDQVASNVTYDAWPNC
jgi:hypothetical protein